MKFKWLEPLGAKRAREGGFKEIFLTRGLYTTMGAFMVMFLIILLVTDVEPGSQRLPLPQLLFCLFLIAAGVSFVIRLIYWVAPYTIHVDDMGIHCQIASEYRTDQWADISDVRIEQRAGWKALAYTAGGAGQREWGISPKVSAQGLLNFIQRKA
jgi:hypothetical protein